MGSVTDPPLPPVYLTGMMVSDTSAQLDWEDGGGDVDGYNIYMSTPDNVSYIFVDNVLAGTLTYTYPGMDAATPYYFKVTAYNATDESDYSNEVELNSLFYQMIAYLGINEESAGSLAVPRGDFSNHGNNLLDKNTVASRAGLLGLAGDFVPADETSLWLDTVSNFELGDIDYTISVIVKIDSKAQDGVIVAKEESTNPREFRLQYQQSSDRFRFIVFSNAGSVIGDVSANTLGSPSVGTFYYIIAEHDSVNNKVRIKVNNGAYDEANTTDVPAVTSCDIRVGAFFMGDDPHPTDKYWDGSIEHLSVWKRLLSSTERTTLYNAGTPLTYPFRVYTGKFAVSYSGALEYWNVPIAVHYVDIEDRTYIGFIEQTGQVKILYYDHGSGAFSDIELVRDLTAVAGTPIEGQDDHNTPAMIFLTSGKIMMFYCIHDETDKMSSIISTNAEDITAWDAPTSISDGSGETHNYPQPHRLASGDIILFYRRGLAGVGELHYKISDDEGATWGANVELLNYGDIPAGAYSITFVDGANIYIASNYHDAGANRRNIYFIYSDDEGSTWYTHSGSVAPPLDTTDVELVYNSGSDPTRPHDIGLDPSNSPCIVFSTKDDPNCEYRFARWNGASWDTYQITTSAILYGGLTYYYTGGAWFEEGDVYTVYLSKERTRFEIEKWVSDDQGATWTLADRITKNSVVDNFRPMIVKDADTSLPIIWMSGFYEGYVGGQWTGFNRMNIQSPITKNWIPTE